MSLRDHALLPEGSHRCFEDALPYVLRLFQDV